MMLKLAGKCLDSARIFGLEVREHVLDVGEGQVLRLDRAGGADLLYGGGPGPGPGLGLGQEPDPPAVQPPFEGLQAQQGGLAESDYARAGGSRLGVAAGGFGFREGQRAGDVWVGDVFLGDVFLGDEGLVWEGLLREGGSGSVD